MAKAIMIQGAGSNVGKSLIVAGLARAYRGRGLRVRPFKPQNMSNNSAVTADGGEIGRAQALQARACGVLPVTDMNPVLLKPESEVGAQVIVQGKRVATLKARDYAREKPKLLEAVLQSFERLSADTDLILVEGAGSPAEVNLRAGDIANMGFAEAVDIPVALVGDIDRGGVIAQIVGTHAVLPEADRNRISAFLINKFRGDVSLFDDGCAEISAHTQWPCLGVLPWFELANRLPAEDVLDLRSKGDGSLVVAVPKLQRIANFDDLDPLAATPGVEVRIIEAGQTLPCDAALVLIPGSKSTIADLNYFRAQGWDIDLAAHIRRGGAVVGLCGGYQMLGHLISDPEGIEGKPGDHHGLGHLNVETVMHPEKRLVELHGCEEASGLPVRGYEIHIGKTDGPDRARPWLQMGDSDEGAVSENGLVRGSYLHGIFASDAFRTDFLSRLGGQVGEVSYDVGVDKTLNTLSAHLESHVDLDALLSLAREPLF